MDQSRLLLRQIQFPNCQRSIDTNTSSHFYVCKRVRLNLLKSYWSIKEKFYYNDWWTVKCSNEDMGRWLSWSTSQNNYSSFSINFSQSAQSSLWGRPGTPPGCSPPPPPPPRSRGSADPWSTPCSGKTDSHWTDDLENYKFGRCSVKKKSTQMFHFILLEDLTDNKVTWF